MMKVIPKLSLPRVVGITIELDEEDAKMLLRVIRHTTITVTHESPVGRMEIDIMRAFNWQEI